MMVADDNKQTEENSTPETIRVFGTVGETFVDGPGVRMAVFVQGCPHHCPGCHNPESQLMGEEYGEVRSIIELAAFALSNPMLSGLTLSGGEPFAQPVECATLAVQVKELRPDFTVWTYSGYTFERLLAKMDNGEAGIRELLLATDVLVDGPFIQAQKSYSVLFRGSANQRLIDVAKSLEKGYVVEINENELS